MKKGYQVLKRMLSLIMVFAMVLTMLPTTVFAADTTVTIAGSFNSWDTGANPLTAVSGSVVTTTMELSAGNYEFKIIENGAWMGNGGTIENTTAKTSNTGWEMKSSEGSNCKLTAAGGTYAFTYNYSSNMLFVTCLSDITLRGTFNGWSGSAAPMKAAEGTIVSAKLSLAADTYTFKVYSGGAWMGSGSAINDITTEIDLSNSGGDISMSVSGGTYIFAFDYITNKLVVTKEYTVDHSGVANLTFEGADTVISGNAYTATLTADENYTLLSENIVVKVGDTTITDGYSYNSETGKLTIEAGKINGNIAISATAVALYTVGFANCDGVASQSVAHGKTATKPANDPTKTGYTFDHWCSDAELKNEYNFSTPVTANMTLYAKWTANNYTVTFDSNGGSTVEQQSVAYGNTASEPTAPTKTGYTFVGWYSDKNLTSAYAFTTTITDNVTLYAKWTEAQPDTYTVTFNVDGGSAVEAQIVAKDQKATRPADPTKTGSSFKGWYSDATLSTAYNFDTPVTANVTLYAKWELNQYEVTFDADNGSTASTVTVNHGSKVSKPADPAKDGYTFVGWFTDATSETAYDFTTEVTGDVNLKAKWTAITYTVTFESNQGSAVQAQTIGYNGKATKPADDPTRDGYEFKGWYSDSALTTAYNFEAVVTQSMTLYAKWDIKTYTVTFETNGGSEVAAQTIEHGKTATEPENKPTKESNLFGGWYSDKELTTAYDFSSKVTGPVTLYAKWAPLVTVYFRNDWLWTDVSVYTWTGDDTTGDKVEYTDKWPGAAMTKMDTSVNGYEVYKAQIPANCKFIFNGIKNDGSGARDQSPNLSTPVDNNIYYMLYVEGTGNTCPNEVYDPNAGDAEKTTYTAIFHFANTLNWSPVNLYVWNDDGATLGSWPGTALSQDPNTGYHTATVTYESADNKGLNYIFNNGGVQTVDLKLEATAFDTAKNNTAEVWVELDTTPDANQENKFVTKQVVPQDFNIVLAVSPQLDGNKVTFEYLAPNAATVEVRGNLPGVTWDAGKAMTKNDKGIWTVTFDNLAYGVYEYKFVVDGEWTADPANGKVSGNGNSTFTIVDPNAKDENKITINIYYERTDGIYEVAQSDGTVAQWNAYVWADSMAGIRKDFTKDANGKMVTTVEVVGRDTQYVCLKTRLSTKDKEWLKEESEVKVNLEDIVSGTINVYIKSAGENGEAGGLSYSVVTDADIVTANKVTDVQLDYDNNKIVVTTLNPVADPEKEILLRNFVDSDNDATVTGITTNGNTYTLSLDKPVELVNLYQYKILFGIKDGNATTETAKYYQYDVGISSAYASKKFGEEFTYTGTDLGATYTANGTTFKVWAPTATEVNVKLYKSGTDGTNDCTGTHAMTRDVNGTWVATVTGDLNGVYYTYEVTRDGETIEAVDPYARTTGVNGNRGMIIDLGATAPDDGWSEITNKPASYTDAIIYELHVRDFSIDDSSGVKDEWQGKFLGLTQSGTKTANGTTTGLDYLKELGITHLHLLPIYDYASVDETTCNTFNWGYDPQNYNVPEGSYSTDPYNGAVRVEEMKEMVDTLHENEIGVVMDVVYNHVYNANTFCFNQIVPGYFSRVDSNASGCGNDTASEREMVRKYIVDSVVYWAKEYHIDGFRFDLVGLLDTETINQIVTRVHTEVRSDIIFYGEGWNMDGTNKEPGTEMAKQGNAYLTPGFAYFSDSMRDKLAGSNGSSLGFVSGENGLEGNIVSNFLAYPDSWGQTWTTNPQQVVQYVSCHDNYTLADKLVISTGKGGLDSTIVKMNNLSAAIYMTAQGIPFIHAGEEFLREKINPDGSRNHNSYNSPDSVNKIVWTDLDNAIYQANVDYYKGLIEFRKAHPALSLSSASEVAATVINQQASDNVVSFWLDSEEITEETVDSIYVIFNANNSARTITLPAGEWNVCIDGKNAGAETLYTAFNSVSVAGISAMVLTQVESTEEPSAKSDYALPGSFNGWNQGSYMNYGSSQNLVTTTLSLSAGTYTFKVKNGDTWYGNNGTIEDTTTTTADAGWDMDASAGDCILKATGGAYTFTFDADTKKLIITHDPQGGTFGDPDKYYLCGYIDGEDYAMGMDTGAYAFDENGKLTTTFTRDSYVLVKNGNNSERYWTKDWLGNVTSATMYNTADVSDPANNGYNKLMVPGGVEVTFTLAVNSDGTVTLTYTPKTEPVADTSGVQDGVTLHCWNWSFAQIEKNMATIAAQGYTAIQTSPVQVLKEATNLSTNSVGSHWWVYYQPVDFVITTDSGNALGTKAELASMIETAHAYGIEVIVDVVANHLGNQTSNNLSDKIPAAIRNNSAYWHNITRNIDNYSDRYQVTQFCMSGLPDLNTANGTVQNYVLTFLKECIDIGVDGFRFDAAKHIETPEDDIFYASDFWPTIVGGAESYAKTSRGIDLYVYGEVLDIIDGVTTSAYTDYMAITDNSWGNSLRNSIVSGTAALTEGYNKVADASHLVIWAESHDTYATDEAVQSSYSVSEANINKTWALVAARADAMGLYLARPESLKQAIGVASATGWDNPEVQAVNLFHNTFVGQPEGISNENGISYVERGTSGVVLVNVAGGEKEVSVTAKAMADGTYTDKITGNVFTVANGKISGKIGATGIAVVYTPAAYVITKGANGIWTQGTDAGLEFTANGAYTKFTGVSVDGKILAKHNYTSKSGSTVVTLTEAYLDTLAVGEHTLTVHYNDGSASCCFTVKAAETTVPGGSSDDATAPGGSTSETTAPSESTTGTTAPETKHSTGTTPPTGDDSNILLWSMLALFSAAVAAALVTMRKRFGMEE